MRKNILCVAVAAASLAAVQMASAADLPAKAPVYKAPMLAPLFSWTGFYIGGNVGYGWGRSSTDTFLDPSSSWAVESVAFRNGWAALSNGTTNTNGVVGGLQAGYNYQMNSVVVGIEVDANASGMKGTSQSVGAPIPPGPPAYTWTRGMQNDWFVTVRPRIGMTFDRTLFYITGGLAIGNVKGSWSVLGNNGYSKAGSVDTTKTGWTLGAGVEHAFAHNWSVKLEYLYTDLGNVSYTSVYQPGSTFAPPGSNYREVLTQDFTFHTARVGLNYRF